MRSLDGAQFEAEERDGLVGVGHRPQRNGDAEDHVFDAVGPPSTALLVPTQPRHSAFTPAGVDVSDPVAATTRRGLTYFHHDRNTFHTVRP